MRKGEYAMFVNYLKRYFDRSVPFRQKWVSFWRYIGMAISYIGEKIRRVDYSMIYARENSNLHGGSYTKTPKKVLRRVFDDIGDIEEKGFIDVGCGKGYVIKMAAKRGFRIAGGIEYDAYLYRVCISNLKKDGVATEHVYQGSAEKFEHYGEFDVFYFNNPFDESIVSPVVRKIFETHIGKKCSLYYLNPRTKERVDAIMDAGFKFVKEIPDSAESYFDIYVYEN